MTKEAGGIGLLVEVDKESPVHDRQAAMENVKAVVQLNWRNGRDRGGGVLRLWKSWVDSISKRFVY